MKITYWNIHGLNKPKKCWELNRIIRSAAYDIIILMETKIKPCHVHVQKNLIWPEVELFTNDLCDTYGRIWVLWHLNFISAWFILLLNNSSTLRQSTKRMVINSILLVYMFRTIYMKEMLYELI